MKRAWAALPLLFIPLLASGGEQDIPDAVAAAASVRGVEIAGRFDAPGGMTGFVGRAGGEPAVLYLTPDGGHVVAGPMWDAFGRNLTPTQVASHLPPPELEDAWEALAAADWVAEGAPEPERIVYAFTDPDCLWCHELWKQARPYLDRGIQLRHVIVGLIGPSGVGKAARVLDASDPAAALGEHVRGFEEGSLAMPEDQPEPSAEARRRVERNNALMERLDVPATPTVFYRGADGRVERIVGLPDPVGLEQHVFRRPRAEQ